MASLVQGSTHATTATTASPGWLHTEGRWIKDGQGNMVGLYGINTYVRLQNEQLKFESAKRYGFNTVRLALWKDDIEHPTYGDPTADKSGLAAIDRAVTWSTQLGLRIILDQHLWGAYGGKPNCWPAPGEFLGDAALQQQWLNMWRLLVDRYKDNPTVVGIDLMNEPYMMGRSDVCPGSKGISVSNPSSAWEGIVKNAVADLKTHNPNLLFIVESMTSSWSDTAFLKQGSILFSSHIYYNGAKSWTDWGKAYASGDVVGGKKMIAKWIDDNWMLYVNQGIPFWVGEIGFLTSDPQWQQQMTDELELLDKRGISYSVYSYAARPWDEPFDAIDHSTAGYALTVVGQIFSSHLLALPSTILVPQRRK